MKNKKIIGITQRVDTVNSYNESRDAIDKRMISWVMEAGFFPVTIPNNLVDTSLLKSSQLVFDQWLNLLNIDAAILSGGNDIGDIPQRDLTESCLLTWAEKNHKPVLGICRGMQMMGIHAGGKLIKADGHVNTHHSLQIDIKNHGEFPDMVNSYHNYVLKDCPESFKVLAKSEDGHLEAMVHKKLPWEAWMWHPEREVIFSSADIKRLKKLMDSDDS